jgi:hypothetical protein
MQLEGFQQNVQYEGDDEKIWLKLIREGADVVDDANPLITIYSPGGTELVASTAMTRDGTTSFYYYELDASTTDDFPLSLDYKADVVSLVSAVEQTEPIFFDVVRYPLTDPLLSTADVDDIKPMWAASRPAGWGSAWQIPIQLAHRELCNDLRKVRLKDGTFARPGMILSRNKVYLAALAYTLAMIAEGIGLEDKELDDYRAERNLAIDNMGPLNVDLDDDGIVDDDERDQSVGGTALLR